MPSARWPEEASLRTGPRLGTHPPGSHRPPSCPITAHITLCHYCLDWIAHESKDPSHSSLGPHFLQSPGSAYSRHPKGDKAKEWMDERSWTNPCMSHRTLTEPKVGKLCSEALGRKPQRPRMESLEPRGLLCIIPRITYDSYVS